MSLGWMPGVKMTCRFITPMLKCSLEHITKKDNDLLAMLCQSECESEWIYESEFGYIIDVDAVRYPVLMLKNTVYPVKRAGLSSMPLSRRTSA